MALAETMIFVSLLAAETIIGFLVLACAAHSLLVVVQDTAAGSDEVVWPDEPFLDWVSRIFHVGWIVGIWLAPIALVLHVLEAPVELLAAMAPVAIWLFVPIGLLSSLGADSGWVVFRPALLPQLVRRAGSVLLFYGLSGLLLALAAALIGASLIEGIGWLFVPVAAAVVAAALLIYARLLGRLAWLLTQTATPVTPASEEASAVSAAVEAPAAPPAPPAPPIEAYGLLPEAPDAPPLLPRINGNGHKTPEPQPPTSSTSRIPWLASWPGPTRRRPKHRPRYQPGQPPRYPFWTGVFSFPFYIDSLRAWATLAFGLLVLGVLAQLMYLCFPR